MSPQHIEYKYISSVSDSHGLGLRPQPWKAYLYKTSFFPFPCLAISVGGIPPTEIARQGKGKKAREERKSPHLHSLSRRFAPRSTVAIKKCANT